MWRTNDKLFIIPLEGATTGKIAISTNGGSATSTTQDLSRGPAVAISRVPKNTRLAAPQRCLGKSYNR